MYTIRMKLAPYNGWVPLYWHNGDWAYFPNNERPTDEQPFSIMCFKTYTEANAFIATRQGKKV